MNSVHSKDQPVVVENNIQDETYESEIDDQNNDTDPLMSRDDIVNDPEGDNEDGVYWFSCPLCTYKGKKKSNLDKHMKYHNSKYQCEYCQKYFPDPAHLKRHVRVHTNSANNTPTNDSLQLTDEEDLEFV